MKRPLLYLALILLFTKPLAFADESGWKVSTSTHFQVYYKQAPEEFIKQLIDKSEDYYSDIADDLGFTRFNFWLWDNRAKIYIHDNQEDFQAATGQPKWSAGSAQVDTKTIQTFTYAQGFTETILPHEMGHIIFREFIGFDNPASPLWLDEGVACYQEKSRRITADSICREAIKKGDFLGLVQLSRLNQDSLQNGDLVKLFYAEAFSLVDFLMKEFDKDKFVYFCQNLRDKKNFESAVSSSYPFGNIDEFDSAWQKYLKHE